MFITTSIGLLCYSLLMNGKSTSVDKPSDLPDMYSSKSNVLSTTGCNPGGRILDKDFVPSDERQILGRYGVWLLVELCTSEKEISKDVLGRLLSMLFYWFHITAYTFDGTKKSLVHLIFTVGKINFTLFP